MVSAEGLKFLGARITVRCAQHGWQFPAGADDGARARAAAVRLYVIS